VHHVDVLNRNFNLANEFPYTEMAAAIARRKLDGRAEIYDAA
jgi:hypothetical protein